MSRSSQQLTLKKGAPGDYVLDLLCMQLASYLERVPLIRQMPLHLHVNQKSDYDMMKQFGYKLFAKVISRWHSSPLADKWLRKSLVAGFFETLV